MLFRRRNTLQWSITLSVVLMVLNIMLMVGWIVLLASQGSWPAMTIGTVAFALILVGLSFYLFLTIKENRLNRRQANFVDSVTHELKTPIAALRLYLETLQLRDLEPSRRHQFYGVMERELQQLDQLISQLLEVGRLDAIGHFAEPEDISIEPLLRQCAKIVCANHQHSENGVFSFDVAPAVVNARRLILEMIFSNLLDNAVKYAGDPPKVDVSVQVRDRGRIIARICDNGDGVPQEIRKKIFRIFYRGGDELQRKTKGTGLGLYIAYTLVRMLKGKISVLDRNDRSGSIFEVELPGRSDG